jgi:PadR family transcriptional regulator, regulatory protein PadR
VCGLKIILDTIHPVDSIMSNAMKNSIGIVEEMVMRAIIKLGANAHGAAIGDHLNQIRARPVDYRSYYKALERLREAGLITRELGNSRPEAGGRGRWIYNVEKSGHTLLDELEITRLLLMQEEAS